MEMPDGACSVNRGAAMLVCLGPEPREADARAWVPFAGAPMRILVCGGRTYDDRDSVWRTLDDYQRRYDPITIIQGRATGADA